MMKALPQRGLVPVLIAALVALAACAGRRKADTTVVRSLHIEGNDALAEGAIKKRIVTGTPRFYPLAKRRPYDPVAWSTDLERIERYYESEGYFQAEVDGAVEEGKGEVDLTVAIDEGKATTIGAVEISGLEGLPPEHRAEAIDDLPVEVGDRFVERRWGATKELLRARLRALGYFEAAVKGEALVDVATHTAQAKLFVSAGPRYRFGEIRVVQASNPAVPGDWIRDEAAVAIGVDRFFSDALVGEAQRRVFSMGVFSVARVTPGPADRASGRVPLIVEVQEAPFHTLRLGGGVGVDQIRNEGRLLAEWTDRNFRGGLRQLNLRAQVGYAFLPNAYSVFRNVAVDTPRHGAIYTTGVDFEQPRIFGAPSLRLQTGVESERRLEQAFTSIGGRGKVGVAWRPWADLSIVPSYQLEGSWLDASGAVSPAEAPETLGCSGNPCFVLLSFLEQAATLDRRDNALEPREGYFGHLSLQEGGGPLGGTFDYLRVLADGRYFVTPDDLEWLTLAVRASAGAIYPRSGRPGDSPIMQRFYAGGATSHRGFNARRLSPLIAIETEGANPQLVALPIGGNGLLLGTAETRFHVSDSMTLAIFLDAGNVTRGRPGVDDLGGLLYAVGAGLRYRTPIGPLRVDFARRLPFGEKPVALFDRGVGAEPRRVSMPYEENDSCFGFGGSKGTFVKDSFCVLHISLGEAF